MIFDYQDYRLFLRAELAERIKRNPSYSLRAMAKQIEVSPSALSRVLNGQKNFSSDRALKTAEKLGLATKEQEYFFLLIQFSTSKKEEVRANLQEKLKAINPKSFKHNLDIDIFKVIADWYHIPILEMTGLYDFKFEARSISKKLGISIHQAKEGICRLERLKLIKKDSNGRYIKSEKHFLFESKKPEDSLRKFHRQMLEKAAISLKEQMPEEKIVASETFPININDIKKAYKLTKEYLGKMVELSKVKEKKTAVYHLGVQFFNLTKEKKK